MGAKSLTHSAGQPERVREKSQSEATKFMLKFHLNWVGVGAAERVACATLCGVLFGLAHKKAWARLSWVYFLFLKSTCNTNSIHLQYFLNHYFMTFITVRHAVESILSRVS